MVTWDLSQIRTLVRDLTATPDTDQLSNAQIDNFINTYYTFEMPFELKEQINLITCGYLTPYLLIHTE